MAILDEFDPQTNGWFFENWGEGPDFSWDLFRRTYLGVNPSNGQPITTNEWLDRHAPKAISNANPSPITS